MASTQRRKRKDGPTRRDYLLATLLQNEEFTDEYVQILNNITDPKDGKALMIMADPAWIGRTQRRAREPV